MPNIFMYCTFSNSRTFRLKNSLQEMGFDVHYLHIVPGRFIPYEHFIEIIRNLDDMDDLFATRSSRITPEFYEELMGMSISELYEYAIENPRIFRDTILYAPGPPPKVVLGFDKHELTILEAREARQARMLGKEPDHV